MIRKIDELGRIGIPKEVRESLKLSAGTALSISWNSEKGEILLRKDTPACAVCGTKTELVRKSEITLCSTCLKKILPDP